MTRPQMHVSPANQVEQRGRRFERVDVADRPVRDPITEQPLQRLAVLSERAALVLLDDPLAHNVGVEAVGQGYGGNRNAGLQAGLDDSGPELG